MKPESMEIQQIYRWHLVRLYRAEQLAARKKEDYIEVSIHPFQKKQQSIQAFLSKLLNEKTSLSLHDHYGFWDLSDEHALAGTVREKVMIKYLADLDSVVHSLKKKRIPIRRNMHLLRNYQLEEDMVFLQLCTHARQFDSLFSSLKKRKGIHPVDSILTQGQSMLFDYTMQARQMASQVYSDAMMH